MHRLYRLALLPAFLLLAYTDSGLAGTPATPTAPVSAQNTDCRDTAADCTNRTRTQNRRSAKMQARCRAEPEKCSQLSQRRRDIRNKAKQRCARDPHACLQRDQALQRRQKALSLYIRDNNAFDSHFTDSRRADMPDLTAPAEPVDRPGP